MTRIQFGFILPQFPRNPAQRATFVADLHRALALVGGHFASAHMIDHLMNNTGSHDDIESFTTLAYLAALHPQLKFGHTVICQSFRNPALVAKMAATLQLLSGGRFLFGVGAGGDAQEHRAYGYDFSPARMRVEQLEEALQIIQALWTGQVTTFSGAHYRVEAAVCEPRPDPLPPIMIGAFQPKMLRLTARYADEWNVSSTGIEAYRRLVETMDRQCAGVGRDPSTLRRSWAGGCTCRSTPGEAERIYAERYGAMEPDEFDFVGTPAQLVAHMRPFIDLGVSAFLLDCGGFPDLTTLELLSSEVLPALSITHSVF